MALMQRPAAQWFITLVLAVVLVGLGYELARHELLPELKDARLQASVEASRANRLLSENQSLEQRLSGVENRLATRSNEFDPRPEAPGAVSRILHRSEATLLLDGRLVLTLDEVSGDRSQAEIRYKVLGGQETLARLKTGGDVSLRLDGRHYHLILKKIMGNSVFVTVLPEG